MVGRPRARAERWPRVLESRDGKQPGGVSVAAQRSPGRMRLPGSKWNQPDQK